MNTPTEAVDMSLWRGQTLDARTRRLHLPAWTFAIFAIVCGMTPPLKAQTFGCSPAMANDIVCENSKPGSDSSNWLPYGIGDPTIQGFATDISVAQGATISFKINTPASAYTIAIYRLGYYQGNGARFITSINPSASLPQTQPPCVTDATTSLYDCGNWAVSASWQVPANATSGVYFALLTRTDTGGDSQIVFVVRNDSSHSAVYFQTSDETWQAYNTYGGNGLYGGPTTWNLPGRAYKVSYNRPFVTRTFNEESATWVYGAEYPMIRFLESNGYDVTYFSGLDAERNGSLILNHKVYISNGHDEYVSGAQRSSLETARAAGVNLAFFSGNEIFWKTRWENSIDGSNTPYRTLVCYKETLDGTSSGGIPDPKDPPTWTGTWRDPRFSPPADAGRPENALTGTLFMVNGDGPDNPGNLQIQVPQADGKMRFWRNTSVAQLSPGQTAMLPKGSLGYEWDVDADNGSRPAGLIDLSTATYNLTVDFLLDYGATYGAGTATHHMTMYRAPSGALVFGAGTIQWAWGLDANHDNPFTSVFPTNPPASTDMQQATVNLFADMGVQPATLKGGLVLALPSTDTTAPVSTITSPASATTEQLGVPITITGTATDSGGGVVGGVEVSGDGGATWHPGSGRENWTYTWTPFTSGAIHLLSRAVDDSGNLEIPSPGVTVNVPTPPISIDAQTSKDGSSASSTITTSAFSTSASNELLLALISGDYISGANTTVTGVSGAGLTWTLVARTNAQSGNSEIWRAFAPSPLSSVTVTATLSQSVISSITVVTFVGVNTSGNGAGAIGAIKSASSGSGAPSATLVTTANNSLVIGVGNDFDNALARTPASGQNVIHQDLTSTGDTYWVQMKSAAVFVSGTSVTISDTAPDTDRYNLTICEILASTSQSSQTGGISGVISPAAAGNGAQVILSGTSSATTTANSSGAYSFSNLPNGNYTVTPSHSGFTFNPSNQPVTVSGNNVAGINFTGTAVATFTVSGTISPAASGSGSTVTLSSTVEGGSTQTTTADASGNFSFTAVTNGGYTVTPTKTGFTFTPPSLPETVSGANLTGVNFTANSTGTFSISGTISPLSSGTGVTVTLSGNSSGTTTTDGSGNYTFSGLANGSYTVAPSKAGLTFSPTSLPETVNGSNITGANFTVATYSLSGTISPASLGNGVTVALSGSATATTTANASGVYSFSGLANGSYTVTPSKTGLTFNPANLPETIAGASLSNVNFAVQSWTISGTISPASLGSGATVTLSGAASASTTADGSGNYSFAGLLNGAYTVNPSKTGITFSPANLPETVSGANITGANFTVQTYSISGTISSGAGATVTLSGAASATTTADVSGNFSFTGLINGSYTLTPSKSGFTFNPTSLGETVSGANITGANFTAQAVQASSLAIDAKVSKDGTAASTTIATPAFSTTATNELLLAFVSTDFISGTNTTVTGVSGAGLTWVLVLRTNVQSGSSEIWRAFAPSALTNVTVTATVSHSVVSSITLVSFTGANATGTNGSGAIGATKSANAKPGAPSASLVTTHNGSWVFGVGNDYDNAITRTVGAGQTLVHQILTSTGDTYWVQMQASPTPLSGTTVTINDTAPATDRYNLSICEILPAN